MKQVAKVTLGIIMAIASLFFFVGPFVYMFTTPDFFPMSNGEIVLLTAVTLVIWAVGVFVVYVSGLLADDFATYFYLLVLFLAAAGGGGYFLYRGIVGSPWWFWISFVLLYIVVCCFSRLIGFIIAALHSIAGFILIFVSGVSWEFWLPMIIVPMLVMAILNPSETVSNTTSSEDGKEASVLGRAVIGGIIAGGAGAVVGALSAVDKNNRNSKKDK